jgi:hypothetical protein
MRKISKFIFLVGVATIILGLVANTYVIAHTLSPDGILEKSTKIKIYLFQTFLVILGIMVILLSRLKKLPIQLKKPIKRYEFRHFFLPGFKIRHFKRRLHEYAEKIIKILKNLLLLFSVIVIFLIIVEVGVRVFAPQPTLQYKINQIVGSTLMPNMTARWTGPEFNVEVRTNSEGFRDIDHELEKEEGVFRIVVLGDSFVEGVQVPYKKTFHKILERELNEKLGTMRFEVINFGVSGYGTTNEYLVLKNYALKYEPDLVMVAFLTGNDLRNNNMELEYDNYYRPFFVLNGSEISLTYYNPPPVNYKQNIILQGLCKYFQSCQFFKKKIDTIGQKVNKTLLFFDNYILML